MPSDPARGVRRQIYQLHLLGHTLPLAVRGCAAGHVGSDLARMRKRILATRNRRDA